MTTKEKELPGVLRSIFVVMKQYSIALLLTVVAIVAVLAGVVSRQIHFSAEQRHLVGEFESLGATVGLINEFGGPKSIGYHQRIVCEDLINLLKKTEKLSSLCLDGSGLTDKELALMPRLNSVVQLDISDTAVSDEGIKLIPGSFPNLMELRMNSITLTRSSLESLSGLSLLDELHLNGTNVTDDDMRSLLLFEHLMHVEVKNTNVTPDGIAKLSGWRQQSPRFVLK